MGNRRAPTGDSFWLCFLCEWNGRVQKLLEHWIPLELLLFRLLKWFNGSFFLLFSILFPYLIRTFLQHSPLLGAFTYVACLLLLFLQTFAYPFLSPLRDLHIPSSSSMISLTSSSNLFFSFSFNYLKVVWSVSNTFATFGLVFPPLWKGFPAERWHSFATHWGAFSIWHNRSGFLIYLKSCAGIVDGWLSGDIKKPVAIWHSRRERIKFIIS